MKTRRFRCGIIASVLAFSMAQNALAQDWPQWRGPNRDGLVGHVELPQTWPESLKLKWQVEVGGGRSSPVVAGERIFLHTRRGEQEAVSALSLDHGKLIWRQSNDAPFKINQYALNQGKGPLATPLVRSERLYALGVNGLLSCFDVETGKLQWRQSFKQQVDTSKLFCGTSASPIIEDDLCIVHVGDDNAGALIAFDVKTGEEEWRWEEQGPGYASPIVVEIEGVKQLVTLTDEACIGVAPRSGELLWQVPFRDEWNENIVTPVSYDGLIVLSGVRKGTFAIKVVRQGGLWEAETVWENSELPMYMSSPLLTNGTLFGLSSKRKGQFFALDPKTGKQLWTSEGRSARNASITGAGDLLFLLTTVGELLVAKMSPESFSIIKRYPVADKPVWAHPVLLKHQLLVKDDSSLALWSLK